MTVRTAATLLLAVLLMVGCADQERGPSSGTVALRRALAGCDRIVVLPGGQQVEDDEREILLDVAGVERVGELVAEMQIEGNGMGAVCACIGSLTLQFYRGASVAALLSYHHGVSLRWPDGPWSGDGELTASSRAFLRAWFQRNGIENEFLLGG